MHPSLAGMHLTAVLYGSEPDDFDPVHCRRRSVKVQEEMLPVLVNMQAQVNRHQTLRKADSFRSLQQAQWCRSAWTRCRVVFLKARLQLQCDRRVRTWQLTAHLRTAVYV